MNYPMRETALAVRRRDDGGLVLRQYITDEELVLDREQAKLFYRLDGKTDPFSVPTKLSPQEVMSFLEALDEGEFIRWSWKRRLLPGTVMYTVWVPQRTRRLSRIARIYSLLLRLLWLPTLIAGVYLYTRAKPSSSVVGTFVGLGVGLFCGVVLHELSHGMVGIANGLRLFESGLMLWHFLPGAYVLMDVDRMRLGLKRVQVLAAGVEMNLLLAGVSLLASGLTGLCGGLGFGIATNNILLAAMNLSLVKGFDGWRIMTTLLGTKELSLLPDRRTRSTMKQGGTVGRVYLLSQYVIFALQILLPVVLILNVLELIGVIR